MSVLQRPLFLAGGGGAQKFPDLSGDGRVTQKDILIGRGVLPRKMQEGGIAAMMPPAPPMDVPAPPMDAAAPPMDSLAADVLAAREEGEKIGLDYLTKTMDGIDDAANTEELINSIRGNEQPLEARVAELASFVGEADARQTPESVLTMVQPTIMMTEDGALDSGVGNLLQQVLMDTDVEGEMAGGIGSLMAAGQPEPMGQPVQQFYQGGAVKKFKNGTSPFGTRFPNTDPIEDPLFGTTMARSQIMADAEQAGQGLADIYGLEGLVGEEYAPVLRQIAFATSEPRDARTAAAEFQKLMEEAYDVEGQKKFSDRQQALDLAQAAFAFASGRDPRTGENIAGRPLLSQLGSAAGDFAQRAGERLAQERKGEQAIRLAAVQQGIAAEERDKAAEEARRSEVFGSVFKSALDRRALEARGKITAAGFKQSAAELASQLGVNVYNRKESEQFQRDLVDRKAEINEDLTRLTSELDEARAANDFVRTKELQEILQNNQIELIGLNHQNRLIEQADQISRLTTKSLSEIDAQGQVQKDLLTQKNDFTEYFEKLRQEFLSDENQLDRDLRLELQGNEIDLREELLALEEEKFALQKGLSPDTSNSFLFDLTGFGGVSEAREIREVELEILELRAAAQRQGIGLAALSRVDQDIQNYLALTNSALQQEALGMRKSQALMDALAAAGAQREFGTTAQQFQLLGDDRLIRAYGEGQNVPGFDLALTNLFGTVTVDNRGNQVPARPLTPTLRAALIKRKEAGAAIPTLPGFALGGEVDMGAGQGLVDPVTGYKFPMETPAQDPEQIPRTYEPLISRDIADITKATGSREAIGVGLGNVANTVANILFGTDSGLAADERQAKKAVEALGTVATTTLMAAIPGKDNVELQRMLKNLQVPADSFVLQDEEALDYFKLARNTMALGIQNQEDLLDEANLTRKEITKVQTDLAQMNSIQAEYDNIIKAYEAKLKPSDEVFDELDKFFK